MTPFAWLAISVDAFLAGVLVGFVMAGKKEFTRKPVESWHR